MAKIDVTAISGYAEMTPEEKLAALEAYEFEVPSGNQSESEAKLKEALSRANGDAAEWKRKYRATLDDAKRAEEERIERDKERDEKIAMYEKQIAISNFKAQYLSAGYSPELAEASAKAQADGDTATVMENQLKFLEETKKNLEVAALGKQPPITPGKPPKGESDEDKFFATVAKYAGLK